MRLGALLLLRPLAAAPGLGPAVRCRHSADARPYQSRVSPYFFVRSAANPSGHSIPGPRPERSTTTSASCASQSWSRRDARTATTSATGTWYGGAADPTSYGAPGGGGRGPGPAGG